LIKDNWIVHPTTKPLKPNDIPHTDFCKIRLTFFSIKSVHLYNTTTSCITYWHAGGEARSESELFEEAWCYMLIDICVTSNFSLLRKLLWSLTCKYFCGDKLSFSWINTLRVAFLSHRLSKLFINLIKNCQTFFSKVTTAFWISIKQCMSFICVTSLHHTVLSTATWFNVSHFGEVILVLCSYFKLHL
jgi:hypothetical protein